MKIFPYIMVRLAGLPYDWMLDLTIKDKKELEDYIQIYKTLQQLKESLTELLEESPEQLHCGFMLRNLYHLKIDLQNNRRIKVSNKLHENLLERERPFYQALMDKLAAFQKSKKGLESAKIDFGEQYDLELAQSRFKLQQFSGNEILKKGLLMASLILSGQLEKYRNKNVEDFRKKEFQTEKSVLQYLSRICMKTSPFSTFTSLSVFHLYKKDILSKDSFSALRLNNYLFSLWRDILNNYPPFYKNMPLGLNPCIKKQEENWVYLLNSRNVESVQNVETNGLLEFIVEKFSEKRKAIVFDDLISDLLEAVEAERERIESYLLELIAYGFLEWRWPFSGLDQHWDKKLIAVLQAYQKNELLLQFQEVLEQIQTTKASYPVANSAHRKSLLLETHRLSKDFSNSLLSKSQIVENQEGINFQSLQHFKADRFDLSPEKIFYEDTSISFQPFWDEDALRPVVEALDDLLWSLEPLFFDDKKTRVQDFFLQHFDPDSTMDLFTFYEAFYQTKFDSDTKLKESKIELQLKWQASILERFQNLENGVLRIEPTFLRKLAGNASIAPLKVRAKALGSLIHLYSEGGQLKGFTESSFSGFGKMMGRFLHLFPEQVTTSLQNWNTKLRGELLWIENTDASLYNPNLHPPLLPYEILMPGSQHTLPVEQQISISDIAIRYDRESKDLILIHKPSGKRAYIFDLGFEAPESRSAMFQLLLAFSPQSGSQKTLTNIVNHYFLQQKSEEIVLLPRIEIGVRLIIQRKKWLIPATKLPLKPQAEKESDYFLRLNLWRIENKIPGKVFIRIHEEVEKGSGKRKDDYKPQYIDFESPLLVQLFHKKIKKVVDRLVVEEILPFPAENIKNQSFASEYLVQWER